MTIIKEQEISVGKKLWGKKKKLWRIWNQHILLEGMYNDTASLENSLAVPKNVKYEVTK